MFLFVPDETRFSLLTSRCTLLCRPATDVDVDAICRYLRNEDLRPKGKDLLFLERDMEARKIAHRRRKMAR